MICYEGFSSSLVKRFMVPIMKFLDFFKDHSMGHCDSNQKHINLLDSLVLNVRVNCLAYLKRSFCKFQVVKIVLIKIGLWIIM